MCSIRSGHVARGQAEDYGLCDDGVVQIRNIRQEIHGTMEVEPLSSPKQVQGVDSVSIGFV